MWLLEFIGKMMILVVITLLGVLVLSLLFSFNFRIGLEYAGLALMGMGALSVIGNMLTLGKVQYNLTKSRTGVKDSHKKDLELSFGSYSFCVFTGGSGLILLLISLIIFYL